MNIQTIIKDHSLWLTGTGGKCANLQGANLYGANLQGADLQDADLQRANLFGANLEGANLFGANLEGANLQRANLQRANLYDANLQRANLKNTCLDPENTPTGADSSFQVEGEYILGYRTEKAGHIDKYRVGQFYSADFFSTSSTDCHPGLFLWPTLAYARAFSGDVPMIKVRTRAGDVHKAGGKYRCRWFEVLELLDN